MRFTEKHIIKVVKMAIVPTAIATAREIAVTDNVTNVILVSA